MASRCPLLMHPARYEGRKLEMKMKLLQIMGGISAIIGLMLPHGWGYEEIMVHQGGKIQGSAIGRIKSHSDGL